jgi:PGF-CTERM protein
MNREALLAGGALLVVALALVSVVALPGALATPEEDVRPSVVRIAELPVSAGPVTGGTATLSVDARLAHRGGPSENVTVLLRAVDAESGLVATTRTLEVGTVTGEQEVSVPGNLTVEREGGYRLEAVLYQDGARVDSGSKTVRGVGALQPPYARTAVGFHRFRDTDLPPVEFTIADVEGNRTTLNVSTYLTNEGDDAESGFRLVLKARQADSGIVATEASVPVGALDPGRTATATARLTVPSDYNYYLDAVLWRDGVVVGTARTAANLDPTETISVNETRRDVGLEVSDFERGDGAGGVPDRTPAGTPTGAGQPGFGVLAALVALLAATTLLRRRQS